MTPPKSPLTGCKYCDVGSPLKNGMHYDIPCADQPRTKPPSEANPRDENTEREAFEKWAFTQTWENEAHYFKLLSLRDDGEYMHYIAQSAFRTWQSATAHILEKLDSPELMEKVARGVWDTVPSMCDETWEEAKAATDFEHKQCVVTYYGLAKAALAVIKQEIES